MRTKTDEYIDTTDVSFQCIAWLHVRASVFLIYKPILKSQLAQDDKKHLHKLPQFVPCFIALLISALELCEFHKCLSYWHRGKSTCDKGFILYFCGQDKIYDKNSLCTLKDPI